MPHPAQIRDAVQVYIEQQYHPVRTWHVQDEIANRLGTRHALVYEALWRLEQEGKVCKHVSPESGAEFWFSASSETFCAICGQLALPGVHTQPECPRRKQLLRATFKSVCGSSPVVRCYLPYRCSGMARQTRSSRLYPTPGLAHLAGQRVGEWKDLCRPRWFVLVAPCLAPSLRGALPSGMVAIMSDGPGMVTIVRSRYGGIYEPGEWIAFACWPDQIPPDWKADDVTCAEFFADRRGEVGGGDTPQEAYEDLVRLLGQRRPGSQ